MNKSRKIGAPQLTCNNNFARVIAQILPKHLLLSNDQAPLKEWIPLAKDPRYWQKCIYDYFNQCHIIDLSDDMLDSDSTSDCDNLSTAWFS